LSFTTAGKISDNLNSDKKEFVMWIFSRPSEPPTPTTSKEKIASLRQQTDDLRQSIHENISQQLANLEATQLLEDKSQELLKSAKRFHKSAAKQAGFWHWLCVLIKEFFSAIAKGVKQIGSCFAELTYRRNDYEFI
jgi:hypothetical protein